MEKDRKNNQAATATALTVDTKEKVNLKDKTILVVDNGLFIELAIKLAKSFKKVYYYTHWKSGFPNFKSVAAGYGIKEIERTLSYLDKIDEIDLFVFPDIYDGDIQEHLVKLGKRVWGSRMGEELETKRKETKAYMKKVGLSVNPFEVIIGLDKLQEYLSKNENKYVKRSLFRGDFETFKHENIKLTQPRLDEIRYKLGALASEIEFIVEDELCDKVELGYDGICIDGEFPKEGVAGIEIKDLGYIGIYKKYDELPKEITDFNKKMKPAFKGYGYRGFASSEIRVGKDHVPFMIDFCARAGSPPSEVYQEVYTNLAEMIWYGAEGKIVEPIPAGKWAVEVLIHSQWADKNWQALYFPEKYRDNIKLRNVCVIQGTYYIVPTEVGLPEIGAIVACEQTLQKAIDKVKKIASEVTGYMIDIPLQSIDTALEEMDKCKEYGIKLF